MPNCPTTLELEDFMAFGRARFELGRHLNVIVGENGTGKTQVLKVLYAGLKVLSDLPSTAPLNPAHLEGFLVRKLHGVFRSGSTLVPLIRDGATKARVVTLRGGALDNLNWQLKRQTADLLVEQAPMTAETPMPVFIPPVDLLSFFPGFVSTYQLRHIEFEETWFDTAMLLGLAPMKQLPTELAHELGFLERLLVGRVELEPSGRFVLILDSGERREMGLVAEGLRKLGVVARLIATGVLQRGASLFWDEPESNLNPRLIKEVAKTIVALGRFGVQVFIATHSLFLLRELEMLLGRESADGLDVRYFGLHATERGVEVKQGPTPADMGDIAVLEEELAQSDRFLEEV